MPLKLANTLSGKVEEFHPLDSAAVRMYSCGPTVYDYQHIGNFRTFVFVDLLRRVLLQSGYKLKHVMNITPPEHMAKATDYIPEMATFIDALAKKDFAYRTDDGSYYFRIAKFPGYGKLSKKDFAGMEDGARVDLDEYEKDSARDFALWKSPKPGEASWETEIGKGRPGWHIECSVMAREFLGDSFDIHLGGEDLIFPHHENEIAQTESLTGKPMAQFWVHCRFLLVEGEKMSKSVGNFYTLRDLLLMGHKASSIRYLLTSVPYTRQLNFTFDGLKQAAQSVERLRNFKQRLEAGNFPAESERNFSEVAELTRSKMRAALEDDMNTAQALAAVFDMVREVNTAADASQLSQRDIPALLAALQEFDQIFDVLRDDDAEKSRFVFAWAKQAGKLSAEQDAEIKHQLSDTQVEELVAERTRAKRAKDFGRSDAIRKQLADGGILVEDTKDGVRWKRK